MDKLLVICPSFNRVSRMQEMINSFKNNSFNSKLIIALSAHDPSIDQYQEIWDSIVVYPSEYNITEIINRTFESNINYAYYSVSNDDFIYHTKGWDEKLINILEDYGDGIAYGNDLLQGKRLPTTSIVSGKIIRILGWLQMPTLKNLYGDEVWKYIGNQLNRLYYLEDVIIEHKHWIKDRSLIDDTYKTTNSQERYQEDSQSFESWKNGQALYDIEKIRSGLVL